MEPSLQAETHPSLRYLAFLNLAHMKALPLETVQHREKGAANSYWRQLLMSMLIMETARQAQAQLALQELIPLFSK